ncbi:MAG: TrmH family RNA methyltransferase, partial [Pirellulaceae bacterium]
MSDTPHSAIRAPHSFEHLRHKPPTPLDRPRELVICCAPMRSNVNLSNMVRTAGCCGVRRLIACGSPKIDRTIARDGADQVQIEVHRTLPPALKKLKTEGYTLVGL